MIYLDHAAATPVSKKALAAMQPYFADDFFNPSAAYLPAKKVRADYENAKATIAHCIGAKGTDVVMTSGATEANNLAFSLVKKKCLVLASEHDSVLNVAKNYQCEQIAVQKSGLIDLVDFKKKLDKDVELVSIALAGNELGTIQPLAEIAGLIRAERERRLAAGDKTPIFLHSDASQAMNLLDINVARLGVDLLTVNSAKVYGPKGVGALYLSHDVRLQPLIYGGGQENGLRSGTENVAGVIGFATAFKEAKEHLNGNRKKYEKLSKILRDELKKGAVEPIFLGSAKHQLANFCPVSYPGIDAERVIFKLEENKVYVSTGAACAASKGRKSHTLAAIGLTDTEIAGSLRLSLGELNSEENIKKAAEIINRVVKEEYERGK
ncbi:cysteine desulfurase [Candidatus Saccharibacteria bacterium]|nr:cysteine desulfurase [Candidatus Saccharibacteria bacterium]